MALPLQNETPALDKGTWFVKAETAERYWVERAQENPVEFMIYYSDGERRPPMHAVEWVRLFFNFDIKRLIIEAFPGSTKTTTMILCMAWLIGKCPWLTHMICSVSEEQAKQRLTELKEILLSERYKKVFPHIHVDYERANNSTMLNIWSSMWKDGKEISRGTYRNYIRQFGEPRDHTVFACGITSSSITGKRISGIALIDDPHDMKNSATPEQREKVTNSIKKEVMSRLSKSPYAKIVIIMTPWAQDDCARRLMQDRYPDGTPVWEHRKTPIRNEKNEPTWKENHTKEDVDIIAANNGTIIFDMMFMLNELAMAGNKITLDMLRFPMPTPMPKFKELVISVDFAYTEKQASDWSVFGAIARDHEKIFNCFMLDGIRFKKEKVDDRLQELINFCDDIFARFGMLSKVLFEENDTLTEFQLLERLRPDIPWKLVKTKGDKESRFKAPEQLIQSGRFFFNQECTIFNAVTGEIIGFPRSQHDDCVDVLSLPFQQDNWITKVERATLIKVRSPLLI